MPKDRSSSRSTRASMSRRQAVKFMPNLKQLNEATKELPDPDLWPEKTYCCPLEVDGKQRTIEFTLKRITRGKERTPRWVYEGKLLIRKRDATIGSD